MPTPATAPRTLVLVLGDQLDLDSAALQAADPACDAVLMIESPGEGRRVWSHRARIALFLAAMRHFRDALRARGWTVHYVGLTDLPDHPALAARLAHELARLRPQRLAMVEPGAWALGEELAATARAAGVPLDRSPDTHFLCSRDDFRRWAGKQKQWRMEFFYRWMRQRHQVLLEDAGDDAGQPLGGRWNFDADNRSGYPRSGPGAIAPPARFEPDAVTREVLAEVAAHFADHPGQLDSFAWPVTREQALQALDTFIRTRLPEFGRYQDAMWTDTPWGWHALLSTSLNLKLLHPLEVVRAAEQAARDGAVPLASAEGFIRQVLGWREFIRGVYWLEMPGLGTVNHYGATRPLPRWYWTGDTQMACLRECIGQTLEHGYAHHIQRLMVTGLFALLAGLDPQAVSDWYLAVYVDAVEWVEVPNVMGMTLYANGGRFTSKPYIASGAYIQRQSNYCQGCRYDPGQKTGPRACPFTTLYGHFLDRHEAELQASPRTSLMVRNLARLSADARAAVAQQAEGLLARLDTL